MVTVPATSQSAYAAVDAAINGVPTPGTGSILPVFPGEDVTNKQLEDWFEVAIPTLSRAGFDAVLRGEVPSHLLPYTYLQDMTGMLELNEQQAKDAGPAASARHNAMVRKAKAENDLKQAQLAAGLMAAKNALAQHLILSLTPKTGLRLSQLKSTFAVSGAANTYDGKGMWDSLVALRKNVGQIEETRDHDRVVELMRDTVLSDGCSAQLFSDKVNELVRDHVPWLERPLAGAALGRFIVRLMPLQNASEGRALIRELTAAGTMGDTATVIQRCMAIVRESEAPATRMAGMAERAAAYGTALTAAAAAMLGQAQPPAGSGVPSANKPKGKPKSKSSADKNSQPDKKSRFRLPEGQLCKEGTCNYVHDDKPCYRAPWYEGPLPKGHRNNERMMARILEAKEANAKRLGKPNKPLLQCTPKAGGVAATTHSSALDGLDHFSASHLQAQQRRVQSTWRVMPVMQSMTHNWMRMRMRACPGRVGHRTQIWSMQGVW